MLQLIQEEISHKKEGGVRIGTYTKQEAFYKGEGGVVQQHRLTLLLNHHICIRTATGNKRNFFFLLFNSIMSDYANMRGGVPIAVFRKGQEELLKRQLSSDV